VNQWKLKKRKTRRHHESAINIVKKSQSDNKEEIIESIETAQEFLARWREV